MKRISTLFAVLLTAVLSQAQSPVITPVNYRGAFAPAPTAMWTAGWTDWDPQNTVYGNTNSVIITPIASNRTLSANKQYLLKGLIYVTNNATLTIKPGCVIRGDKNTANSSLIVTRGAKINAVGTATSPIVFTSNAALGSRNKGDWGGIIILGRAHLNSAGGQNYIEGIAQSANTQYGGGATPNDNDNSGTLKYVRIEYGGYIYAPNQEINGLTLGAVGRGTTIDYVQVSYANDDAFEWFGGSVNAKHLVSYRNLDDDFDTDFGFDGSVQFALSVRDPQIADNPAVSTSEGFESDNDAIGSNAKPFTSGLFTNITIVGPLRGDNTATVAPGYRRGLRLRRNSHLRVINSIFMDHLTGLFVDGSAAIANAQAPFISSAANNSPGNLVFRNNIIAGTRPGQVLENPTGWNMAAWFGANDNDSLAATAGILNRPYNYDNPDYRPAANSAALMNYTFNDSTFYHIDSTGTVRNLIACPPSVPSPAVVIGNAAVCTYVASGDTARYYLSAKSQTGVLSYDWSLPAGVAIVDGQATDTLIVTFSNSFSGGNITVRNFTYCGTYSPARIFSLTTNPPAAPTAVTGPVFVCNYIGTTDEATYSVALVKSATSYDWTVPAGVTITSADPSSNSITVTIGNTFTGGDIIVKAVNSCGISTGKVLTLKTTSPVPGAIKGAAATCGRVGTPVSYSINAIPGVAKYKWVLPAGADFNGDSTGNTVSVTYSSAVSGNITVRSVTSCGFSLPKTLKVAVVATPKGINGDLTVCPGETRTYAVNDTVNVAGTVYIWSIPAGATFTGQNTSSIDVTFPASFTSGVISVKAQGCNSLSAARKITVTASGSCLSGRPITVAGEEINTKTISVYPNPAVSAFTLSAKTLTSGKSVTVQITNSYGQVVRQETLGNNKGIINRTYSVENLPAGLYSVDVISGGETQMTKLLIK